MDRSAALASLGALAHPIRLDAFRALVVVGRAGLTPGALTEMLGLAYAKLGFHLKELVAAGLVESEPSGRHMIYRAVYPQMDALIVYLTENCCAGDPCDLSHTDKPCC